MNDNRPHALADARNAVRLLATQVVVLAAVLIGWAARSGGGRGLPLVLLSPLVVLVMVGPAVRRAFRRPW